MSKPCLTKAKTGSCSLAGACPYADSHGWTLERLKGASLCKFGSDCAHKGCPFVHQSLSEFSLENDENVLYHSINPKSRPTTSHNVNDARDDVNDVKSKSNQPCINKATWGVCVLGDQCSYADSHDWTTKKLEKASRCTVELSKGICKKPRCRFRHSNPEGRSSKNDGKVRIDHHSSADGDRISPLSNQQDSTTINDLIRQGKISEATEHFKFLVLATLPSSTPADPQPTSAPHRLPSRQSNQPDKNKQTWRQKQTVSHQASIKSDTTQSSTSRLVISQEQTLGMLREALREKDEILSSLQVQIEQLTLDSDKNQAQAMPVNHSGDPLVMKGLARLDHYELLSVSRDATLAQIQKAFLQASMKYHPDLGGDGAIYSVVCGFNPKKSFD